jgi:hypothetical protein
VGDLIPPPREIVGVMVNVGRGRGRGEETTMSNEKRLVCKLGSI